MVSALGAGLDWKPRCAPQLPWHPGSLWEVALTGEGSVLRRGVTSGLAAAAFRRSQQRCGRRWLWQGLRGLAEAERGHTGTGGGVTRVRMEPAPTPAPQ